MCDSAGEARLIARVTALAQHELPLVRCAECGSLDILDTPLDSSPTEASVDDYVEAGAGIGTIADCLVLVDPRTVRRFLDVGCNYGFALDLGRYLYKWDVLGVEPSLAGSRGAAELGLDIRREYLTADSQIGDDFDLILASEVVEHVPQPREFLESLRVRLGKGGSVVLTTPAAEIINTESPIADVLGAVSAGYHVFVASERGLELLLRRAGFTSVRVFREGGSLRAIANNDSRAISAERRETPRLARYYLERSRSADAGSALALGMAVRHLRSSVASGEFDAAVSSIPTVVDALDKVHGVDLREPAMTLAEVKARDDVPWSLPGAAFAMGMIELLHTNNPRRAADFFELAAVSAALWRRSAGVADLDTVDLLFQAPYHRILALSQFDGEAATEVAVRLGSDPEFSAPESVHRTKLHLCRAFVDIVSRGTYLPESALAVLVSQLAIEFAHSEDVHVRTVGLDALFSLGIANLNSGRPHSGAGWLRQCRDLAVSGRPKTSHARQLVRQCTIALKTVKADDEDAPTVLAQPPDFHYAIDVYWCDAFGTYIQGWAHLKSVPVKTLAVDVDGRSVQAARGERPDLEAFWPDHPEVVHGGFRVYIPGRPGASVTLVAETTAGPVRVELELPDHPLPVHPEPETAGEWESALKTWINLIPPGPILAVGVRSLTKSSLARQLAPFAGREVIGLDIHPGIGVDVVGDVHELSKKFPPDHFAAVVSWSLFEHLTTPWVVAAEISRVLKLGGFAIHAAPWTWPSHAMPQDFWRFSTEGLRQLFDARLGYQVRAVGSFGTATVVPTPDWRESNLSMPTTVSDSTSWIVAEKVDHRADDVRWPYEGVTEEDSARRYPLDGLSSEVANWNSPTASQ